MGRAPKGARPAFYRNGRREVRTKLPESSCRISYTESARPQQYPFHIRETSSDSEGLGQSDERQALLCDGKSPPQVTSVRCDIRTLFSLFGL